MIQDSPSGRWLDRLDRLQCFFDGPIPAPERRWIFADPGPAARSASDAWHDLAEDSRRRAERLRRRARHAATPRERRSAAVALAEERDWQRHCRDRMNATRTDGTGPA
ncbi:MAG: hypothetical protein IT563_18020 [Alphaproteobacteria bacterium]|nr:hypothetical protein [Alphaproteobacteria bacterium]